MDNFIPQYNLDGLGSEFRKTEELEKRIADFLGVKHCIMTTSGFSALFLSVKALGAKKVAVPTLTMIATATAPELAGCEVVFYDTVPTDTTVDAIIHVSLNGRANYLDDVLRFGRDNSIPVIEDACQAFGSDYRLGKPLGSLGTVGCFSFQAYKLISSGNGGCCITNNDELALKIRKIKNFGRISGGDIHDEMGYNFKFTDIQAEILLKQMDTINEKIEYKKHMYYEYRKYLKDYMIDHSGTPWFVDIYVEDSDMLHKNLGLDNIGTRKMYPLITKQKPFLEEKEYPISQKLSDTGLWLPSGLDITDEQIKYISNKVLEYVRK